MRLHLHLAGDVMLHLLSGQKCVIKACESRDGLVNKEVFVSYLPQPWPSKPALVNNREAEMQRCQSPFLTL